MLNNHSTLLPCNRLCKYFVAELSHVEDGLRSDTQKKTKTEHQNACECNTLMPKLSLGQLTYTSSAMSSEIGTCRVMGRIPASLKHLTLKGSCRNFSRGVLTLSKIIQGYYEEYRFKLVKFINEALSTVLYRELWNASHPHTKWKQLGFTTRVVRLDVNETITGYLQFLKLDCKT